MKFSKLSGSPATGLRRWGGLSQLLLVSVIGLLVATLLTACQLITIDYVYVASSAGTGTGSTGQIQTFAADSVSGALRTAVAPISSGGVDPVGMALTSDYANLYVANKGDGTVVHFTIAPEGTLTMKDKVTLSTPPVALAVNAANTYLYVVSGTSSATLNEYPLTSGAIGTAAIQQPLTLSCTNSSAHANFPNDTIIPTGIAVLANGSGVYVSAYDQSAYNPGGSITSTANPGWIFGFAVGSGGVFTPSASCLAGTTPQPYSVYRAGVKPSALVADPTNRFVYVTDFASNELIGYTIQSGSTLNFLINGPFRAGAEPSAVAIDPRGKYIYVANALDSSVTAYVIDLATGTPSSAVNTTGSSTNVTDTQPVSILVDPAIGRLVYTANFLGNSVSGFQLDPDTGTIKPSQATPYPTGAKPTAVLAVPHGNHSTQVVP